MNLEALTRRILPEEIEWRVQSTTKDKSKTIILPYITNRCVMNRLDEAFGIFGWSSYTEILESDGKIKRGFKTTIEIYNEDKVVRKTDVAEITDYEPLKGGFSDSMKRCAVQLGIGRGLYSYPKVFLKGEVKYISDDVIVRLKNMVKKINSGEFTANVVML